MAIGEDIIMLLIETIHSMRRPSMAHVNNMALLLTKRRQ
jgi:hypothetical protein